MENAAYEEERVRFFDWKIVVLVAIIYSMNAFLFESASRLFPHEERVTIMVPALASVLFGPVIGALGSGFGNLLLDIFEKMVLSSEGLAPRHAIGFLGNLVGGAVTGLYSRRLVVKRDDPILSGQNLVLVLRNTLASILGMAVVTGVIIGYGRWLLGLVNMDTYDLTRGVGLAGAIITNNGFVLLVSMIPLQILFLYVERHRVRAYEQQLHQSLTMRPISKPARSPIEVQEFRGVGRGFVLRSWSGLRLKVHNKLDFPMRYRIEVRAQDHVDPSVLYTEIIPPGGSDVCDLQLYPFDDADRKIQLVFRPWVDDAATLKRVFEEDVAFPFEYTYSVMLPGNRRFKVLVSLVGIMAMLAAVAQALRNLQAAMVGQTTSSFVAFLVTAGVVIAEVLVVVIWYLMRKRQVGV